MSVLRIRSALRIHYSRVLEDVIVEEDVVDVLLAELHHLSRHRDAEVGRQAVQHHAVRGQAGIHRVHRVVQLVVRGRHPVDVHLRMIEASEHGEFLGYELIILVMPPRPHRDDLIAVGGIVAVPVVGAAYPQGLRHEHVLVGELRGPAQAVGLLRHLSGAAQLDLGPPVDQVLVQRPGSQPLDFPADLSGRRVKARRRPCKSGGPAPHRAVYK